MSKNPLMGKDEEELKYSFNTFINRFKWLPPNADKDDFDRKELEKQAEIWVDFLSRPVKKIAKSIVKANNARIQELEDREAQRKAEMAKRSAQVRRSNAKLIASRLPGKCKWEEKNAPLSDGDTVNFRFEECTVGDRRCRIFFRNSGKRGHCTLAISTRKGDSWSKFENVSSHKLYCDTKGKAELWLYGIEDLK